MTEIARPTVVDAVGVELATRILGVPIAPEEISGVSLGEDSVRGFACQAVRSLIAERYPRTRQADIVELPNAAVEALQHEPRIRRLAAVLQAANDSLWHLHHPHPMPKDALGEENPLVPIQGQAISGMVHHAQRAPGRLATASQPLRDGLLTVAPPGTGKTLLQAININYAGVGQPISETDPRVRKAVGVVDSRLLILQGLDKSETLHRFSHLGGRTIRIGAFFGGRHNGHDEYDLLLTTPESYATASRSGAIQHETTVRYILDEAHATALAPSMQEHVARFGSNLYMFTATPAIAGGRRDLRRQFPFSQFGSLREYAQDGVLSPVQLFTYRAGSESHTAEQLAASLAADYIRSGRKTLVVCQPGNKLKQAEIVAELINSHYRKGDIVPHPRFQWQADEDRMIACPVGKYDGYTPRLNELNINRLRTGRRLAVTTVATGKAGLNIVDLDALIIIGPRGQDGAWELEQWIGRVVRPSGRMAIVSEILPSLLRAGKRLASIFGAFGLEHETIEAGYYFGPLDRNEQPEPAPPMPKAAPPLPLPDLQRQQPPPKELYTPPPDLEAALVTGISVREATIAPADLAKLPPLDYKPLKINLPDGVPIEWAYRILDKQSDPNIRYVGTWEPDEDGERQYIRYYSPAAHDYFVTHPIRELAKGLEYKDEDMARLLRVSRGCVRRTIEQLGIQPLSRITKHHRSPKYYDAEAFAAVGVEVAKIPWADSEDEPLPDLVAEINYDYVSQYLTRNNIAAPDKRRHPDWGISGVARHLSREDAHTIREAHKALKVADRTQVVGLTELAKLAHLSLSGILKKWNELPEEAKPDVQLLRPAPNIVASNFIDRQWGEAWAEYLQPSKVLPWEATLKMLAEYFGKTKPGIFNIIQRRAHYVQEMQQIPLIGVAGDTNVFPMLIIQQLEAEGLERAPGMPKLHAERAALSLQHRGDSERIAYSQKLQRHFISPDHLPAADEVEYFLDRRLSPPTLPPPPQLKIFSPSAVLQRLAVEKRSVAAEKACARLHCLPEALSLLVKRAAVADADIVQTQGKIVGLSSAALEVLSLASQQLTPPTAGWTDIAMVAKAYDASIEDILDVLDQMGKRRGQPINETELQLFQAGNGVDIYIATPTKREIRKILLD